MRIDRNMRVSDAAYRARCSDRVPLPHLYLSPFSLHRSSRSILGSYNRLVTFSLSLAHSYIFIRRIGIILFTSGISNERRSRPSEREKEREIDNNLRYILYICVHIYIYH